MDGVGEWTTTSLAIGRGNSLDIHREIHFPHSLGLLYSAFTHYTGFKVNSGEYKVMGLAPYGEPRFADKIKEHLIDLREDGSFRLNMAYFDYCTGLTMTNSRFDQLFGGPARKAEAQLTQREMDLAASIQAVTEEVVIQLAKGIRKSTGQRNLCLAGGVALNCVANGKLLRENVFDRTWVQPHRATPGARSVRRWVPTTSCWVVPGRWGRAMPWVGRIWGPPTDRATSRRACAGPVRCSPRWATMP